MKRVLLPSLAFLALCGVALFQQAGYSAEKETYAEDLLFMDIPVTVASKQAESQLDAAGTVYVITEEDIKRYGWRDLDQILKSIPNMDLMNQYNWLNGGQRGFMGSFNGSLLLIDGREVQNLLAGEAFTSNDFPAHRIKRIEILMGPNSTLYGAGASQGVINIITKFGDQGDKNLSEVEYMNGEVGTTMEDFVFKKNGTDWEMGFSGSHFNSLQNWPEIAQFAASDSLYSRNAAMDPYRDHNAANFQNQEETWTTDLYLRYKGFYGGYDYFKEDNSAGLEYVKYVYGNDEPRRSYTQSYVGYKFDISSDLNGFVEYQHVDESEDWLVSNLVSTNTTSATVAITGQTLNPTTRDKALAQIDYMPNDSNHVIMGYDYWRLSLPNYLVETNSLFPYNTAANIASGWPVSKEVTRENSIFAQDTIVCTQKLKVTFGLRYTAQDYTNNSTLPRASVVYQPTPSSALKLTYGESFRAPSIFDYENVNGQLDSQKMKMTELNYSQNATIGSVKLSNIAAVYNMDATNLYNKIWVGSASGAQLTGWETVVGGSFQVNGIEDTVKFGYKKLNGFLGFRYVQPDKTMIDGQDVVANVPPTKANVGLSYDFLKTLTGTILVTYWDPVNIEANTFPYSYITNVAGQTVQATEVYTVPAWTTVDLNVNVGEFDLDGSKAMLSIYVENLLDTVYYEGNVRGTSPIQYLQPPRTATLKLTMKL